MKWLWGSLLILFFAVGCSNEGETDQLVTEYESQIESRQKEIQDLEKEIQELKQELKNIQTNHAEHLSNLQIVDRESRRVLRLISDGKLEELRNEYNVEFKIMDDGILFSTPESNAPFPFDLAENPAYIGSYTQSDIGTDISYYIMDYEMDKTRLMYFQFDKDLNFKHIFVGAE